MAGFQNLSGWVGRDPYGPGAGGGTPSRASLAALQQLHGVSPTDVPYTDEEQEVAFGQQADDARNAMADYLTGTGIGMGSPALQRARGNAIGGGQWADFSDAIDRTQRMAANRGLNARVDLVGKGPGTGTGIGSWYAQEGHASPSGSFTGEGPDVNLDDLVSDAQSGPTPYTRSTALGALRRLSGR